MDIDPRVGLGAGVEVERRSVDIGNVVAGADVRTELHPADPSKAIAKPSVRRNLPLIIVSPSSILLGVSSILALY